MSLATLEARNGTRTASARALAYHSPVTSSSSAGSEGEWIAQVADGDADAFARLYDAW
ncbi:RNA polymerase subunit sigma, partial [Actinomyces oris]